MAEVVSSMALSTGSLPSAERDETSSLSPPPSYSRSQAPYPASVTVHDSVAIDTSIEDTSKSTIEETLALLSVDQVSPKTMFWSLCSVFQNAYEQEGSIQLAPIEMENLRSRLHRAQYMDDLHGMRFNDDLVACKAVMEQMLRNRSNVLSNAVQIIMRASRNC